MLGKQVATIERSAGPPGPRGKGTRGREGSLCEFRCRESDRDRSRRARCASARSRFTMARRRRRSRARPICFPYASDIKFARRSLPRRDAPWVSVCSTPARSGVHIEYSPKCEGFFSRLTAVSFVSPCTFHGPCLRARLRTREAIS